VGCRLPLELEELDALVVRVVSMSFRGVPLKKMGKRGASGVVYPGGNKPYLVRGDSALPAI
jgi:hypothetical protein